MTNQFLTDEQVAAFDRDGYIMVRQLFDAGEMEILRKAAKTDQAFQKNAYERKDGEGGVAKLVLWNKAGEDIYGAVARCPRIVDAMEQLLRDEVYHYHSKMSIKEPFTGGAWAWHQDYGYWYQNGCLYPDMASAFIAVDPNTRENGCMQVLKGSHRMGRIEHGRYGDQTGADPERTNAAMKVMELVYVELEPGDVLFFHSNTLHRSDPNKSPHPRWSLLCCYNTKHNNPYKESHHPFYEPLVKVPDSRLREMGVKLFSEGTEFWDPARDRSAGAPASGVTTIINLRAGVRGESAARPSTKTRWADCPNNNGVADMAVRRPDLFWQHVPILRPRALHAVYPQAVAGALRWRHENKNYCSLCIGCASSHHASAGVRCLSSNLRETGSLHE
jgi:ectoine hydroxylase-related dioxygenase (phytanoyl-CoA dioxygenase family)